MYIFQNSLVPIDSQKLQLHLTCALGCWVGATPRQIWQWWRHCCFKPNQLHRFVVTSHVAIVLGSRDGSSGPTRGGSCLWPTLSPWWWRPNSIPLPLAAYWDRELKFLPWLRGDILTSPKMPCTGEIKGERTLPQGSGLLKSQWHTIDASAKNRALHYSLILVDDAPKLKNNVSVFLWIPFAPF